MQDENGVTLRLAEMKNDEKGNPVELLLSDGNGNSFGKEKAEYLHEKNKVITAVISKEGKILSTDTSKISYKNARLFPGTDESFNDIGDIVYWTSKTISGKELIYEEEYFYDHFGNWTENRIYKITVKPNGEREKEIDRIFKKGIYLLIQQDLSVKSLHKKRVTNKYSVTLLDFLNFTLCIQYFLRHFENLSFHYLL